MTTRHEYIEKLKNKLDEWDADIDELETKAKEATSELKIEVEDQLAALRVRRGRGGPGRGPRATRRRAPDRAAPGSRDRARA